MLRSVVTKIRSGSTCACTHLCVSAASPDAMPPVEALLDVAAYPDQAISTISFNFWHRLMRRLVLGEHTTLAQHDKEVIASHGQDPAINAHSAVRLPPSPPSTPPPTAFASASWQPERRLRSKFFAGFLDASAQAGCCKMLC